MDSNSSAPAFTDIEKGLSLEESNNLTSHKLKKGNVNSTLIFQVFLNQIRSIFFILLLVSAILSYWLGNHVDAYIFTILNSLNVVIGFIQEFRASKASRTLEKMVKQKVSVLRDGHRVVLDSEEVVKGDIVFLAPGNVLVSDMLVRECKDAFIDESVLTGESIPREIKEDDTVFAGTNIVAGTLIGQVMAAADESSLIAYSEKLKAVRKDNNFAQFVKKVSVYILYITVVCLMMVAIYSVVIEGKYTMSVFVLFAISILIGVVPESLSLIITLMLTREALVLSKEGVIVKNLNALQQLGSIRYLLTDKTGTLTENSIKVADTVEAKDLHKVLAMVAHAEYERTPMDLAYDNAIIKKISEEISEETKINNFIAQKPKVSPFSSKVGYAVFAFSDRTVFRGQFHSILEIATNMTEDAKKRFSDIYTENESKGLRVLAYATKRDEEQIHNNARLSLDFNGIAIFEDPLKSDASHSYLATEGLGIHVKILTGDSLLVAKYVARKLDPHFDDKYVEELGPHQVSSYSEEDIEQDHIYARCMPEQKLELIDRHLAHGAVGFMGEGINDALALKRADVGIAVTNASDVARQSADILLTQKSLNPVIRAIQLSRRAYAHISTYLLCTLTGNIGTLISLTLVALFWTDLPMLPIQILLNNLLTDVPLILLITDHLSKGEYNQPIVHSPKEFFKKIFIFGFISSIFDLIYFYFFKDQSLEILRTGWFLFSVLAELALVFSLRSNLSLFKSPRLSKPLGVAIILSAAVAVLLVYVPVIGQKLSLVSLSGFNLGFIIVLLIVYVCVNEGYKYFSKNPVQNSLRIK